MQEIRRSPSHGNRHFYPNDRIEFKKRNSFHLSLKGLSTIYKLIWQKHMSDRSAGTNYIKRYLDARREWNEFNRSVQLVIDTKLQELEQ
jgi:hypothetical protein